MSIEITDEVQLLAVNRAFDIEQRVVPITGEAGTGKTTIMQHIYYGLVDAGYKVALAAPTGKAAKRIREATSLPAVTIHRLLEYTYPGEPDEETGEVFDESVPRRTKSNPLVYDVLLIDEYAMVDLELHRSIINAMKAGAVIRMFGDISQLPPIEKYKVTTETPFQAAIRKFDGVELTTNYRVQEGNPIIENARKIRNGRMPAKTDNTPILFTEKYQDKLIDTVLEYAEQGINFNEIDHQIIIPQNKGPTGCANINDILQRLYFDSNNTRVLIEPPIWKKKSGKKAFYIGVGDKVVISQNMYDLRQEEDKYDEFGKYSRPTPEEEAFNGEVGIVQHIDEDESIIIDLQDRVVTIPPLIEYTDKYGRLKSSDPRLNIDRAYALTTHKMQGSEVKSVIYLISKGMAWMLSRPNLYTAYTRARDRTMIITDQRALSLSVTKKENK